jgi:hypothetical protein
MEIKQTLIQPNQLNLLLREKVVGVGEGHLINQDGFFYQNI